MSHEPKPGRMSAGSVALALVVALSVGLGAACALEDRFDDVRRDVGAALSEGGTSAGAVGESLSDDDRDDDHPLGCADGLSPSALTLCALSRERPLQASHDRRRPRREPRVPTGPPSTTSERQA